jgi:hypothetical protein
VETRETRDDDLDVEDGEQAVVRDDEEVDFDDVVDESMEAVQHDPDHFPGGVENAVHSTQNPDPDSDVEPENDKFNDRFQDEYEKLKLLMNGVKFDE